MQQYMSAGKVTVSKPVNDWRGRSLVVADSNGEIVSKFNAEGRCGGNAEVNKVEVGGERDHNVGNRAMAALDRIAGNKNKFRSKKSK